MSSTSSRDPESTGAARGVELDRELAARRPDDDLLHGWRPHIFPAADREALGDLLRRARIDTVHDTIDEQLRELVASSHPDRKLAGDALARAVSEHLGGVPADRYGNWVHHPWARRLVRVLPEAEHRFLRTDRNRYKITPDEQARLQGCRIGVIGLSVGRAIALTLAQEGVGGAFVLADFDTLALSNMNRLRGGVQDLGIKKTVLAAREIVEMDPYVSVEVFSEGLTPDGIDRFLSGLDLVVEECDDLYVKVRVRERARALRVPVLMETTEGGLLDVERFDLEPDRPVFHGLLGGVEAEALRGLPTKDKIPYVLKILPPDDLSVRGKASMLEIDESISTWPQLASAVSLGAALVTDVARRVLLGQMHASGRFAVDLTTLVGDATASAPGADAPWIAPTSPAAEAERILPRIDGTGRAAALERRQIEALVHCATLAPSPGNNQPWQFVATGGRLRCVFDRARSWSSLDLEGTASFLALGAAVENLTLAAEAAGIRVDCHVMPEGPTGDVACDAVLSPGATPHISPLHAHLTTRVTNRRREASPPIAAADLEALADAARSAGARLTLATGSALEDVASLLADADRVTLLDPRLHAEFVSELRWGRAQVESTRDGLDVETLELTALDRAGLRLLTSPRSIALVGTVGGGSGLGGLTRKWVRAAGAVGLLTVPGRDRAAYFRGGRALQRLWLTATARRVGVHPMAGVPYAMARFERDPEWFTPEQTPRMMALRARYRALFPTPDDHGHVLLFRLTSAEPPTLRSLRRPVEAVLRFP